MRAQQHVFGPVAVSESVLSRPHDLILSADGRRLLVADLGNHVVRVMDSDTFALVAEVGSSELSAPHDVALDDQGRLLVADTGNNRVAIFELNGITGRLAGQLRDGSDGPREWFRGLTDGYS
jgi:DNA-binding beta-propeller fold protein YncE